MSATPARPPIELPELREPTIAALMPLFRRVCEVRAFEFATSELYRDGVIPGLVHVSLGQEASSVGAGSPLRRSGMIISNHRGHVAKDGFWFLDAPVERVGAGFSPAPYAPNLERAWLPQRDEIAETIRRTVRV